MKYLILLIALIFISCSTNLEQQIEEYTRTNNLELHYDDGVLHVNKTDTSYSQYYKTGKLKSMGKFEEGKRKGKWTWWDEKGEVSYELCYGDC